MFKQEEKDKLNEVARILSLATVALDVYIAVDEAEVTDVERLHALDTIREALFTSEEDIRSVQKLMEPRV